MSKDLKGWEQPEELTPEVGGADSGELFEEAVIDIEIPDTGEVSEETDQGPDLLYDGGVAQEEYEAARQAAEEIIGRKHRRVESAAEQPKRRSWEKHSEPEPKPEPESGGDIVIEEVLMIEEPEQPADGAGQPAKDSKKAGRTRQMLWSRRKHSYAAPLGLAFIILAVVGLIAVVIACVDLTMDLVDNTEEKSQFEWKIYPLLMFDPAAFESPTQLDEVFVLKTALWKTLLENRTKYSYNDNGMLVVPASDLDVAAKSLYGDVVKLSHQSFSEGYEFFYIYDETQNAYMVPVQGQTAQYSPKIVSIVKEDDNYTLMVGYVPPNDLWNIDTEGNMTEPSPSKYMYYDLLKTESGSYHITSVREVPKEELPEDINASGQQQLNQTRYDEYVEDFMANQSGASGAVQPGASEDQAGGTATATDPETQQATETDAESSEESEG